MGQTEISDGCRRLALRAYEEIALHPGGGCRRTGRVAVYLPGGGRHRLADHDRNHALQGLAAVRGSDDARQRAQRQAARSAEPVAVSELRMSGYLEYAKRIY